MYPALWRHLPIMLCLLQLLSPPATSQPAESGLPPIRGCAFQLSPLVNVGHDGSVSGPIIDYFQHYIEPVVGRTIQWQGLNVARLLSNLESGECELVPLLTYTPERAKHFIYLHPNLLVLRPVLVVAANSSLQQVKQQSDLYGTTIGWSGQAVVPPLLQHPQIKIDALSQLEWESGNMQKLVRGRIDAALFSNDISANYFRSQQPEATRLIYLPTQPLMIHTVLNSSQAALASTLDPLLQQALREHPLVPLLEAL